jgi:hypothetical protein
LDIRKFKANILQEDIVDWIVKWQQQQKRNRNRVYYKRMMKMNRIYRKYIVEWIEYYKNLRRNNKNGKDRKSVIKKR